MTASALRDCLAGALIVLVFFCPAGHAAPGLDAIPPAPVDSQDAVAMVLSDVAPSASEYGGAAMDIDDGLWMLVNPSPRRLSPSLMYDPLRRQALMFGGSDGQDCNDTWVLRLGQGATWVPLPTTGSPPAPRRLHTAVYDPVRDRMIVFGGYAGAYFDDVWALTLSGTPAWNRLTPTGGPPAARAGHVAIYDPIGDRMVVFGGHDGVSIPSLRRNDVWALSLAGSPAWTEITPAGTPPSPRSSHSAIYDPLRQQMVVFAGTESFTSYLNDTWTLSLGGAPAWTRLTPAAPLPPLRESHVAIYDANRDRMVVYGGDAGGGYYYDDTWSLSLGGGATWSTISPTNATPRPRWGHAAFYDPDRGLMIVFGGWTSTYTNETRFLTLGATPEWVRPALLSASAIQDPLRHRMIVFGGSDGVDRNVTWVVLPDAGTIPIVLPTTGSPPAPRRLHTAVYDPVRDRMIVFGGYAGTYFDDVWALTLSGTPAWNRLTPTGGPPAARAGHAAIYDPIGDRMVVFGGHDGVSIPSLRRNDVWALSLAGSPAWTEITPAGTPPSPRSSHSAIYDPLRQQMVVFAGTESFTSYLNDTWTLSLGGAPAWTRLTPAAPPPPLRESHVAIYDANRDRMVVYGGDAGGGYYYDDTWSLDLGANAWRSLVPLGSSPGPRWGHVAVYDPLNDRMTMLGGWYMGYMGTLWFLEWGGPVPVELSEFAATSIGEQVVIRWRTAVESGNLGFYVQRAGETDGDFTRISALIESSGSAGSIYEFIDERVTPGQTYSYRLEGVDMSGEGRTYGSVRVLVAPAAGRFLLHPNRPNPFNPSTIIPFELPAGGPVTITVYDGAGRMVRTLWHGAMDVGLHQVEWDGLDAAGKAAGSGVYFCRLEAAGMQSTQKMVLAQ